MKKNKLVLLGLFAGVMMMTVVACSPKAEETTAAPATTAETITESETEEESTEVEEIVKNSAAGMIDDSGKFVAVSGKYELSLPDGWGVDPESDDTYASFVSKDGLDRIDIEYITGDVEGIGEILPERVDEYKTQVLRGDEDAEFKNYKVENIENGQNYSYSVKYNDQNADPKYMSIVCSYDTKAGQYFLATGTVNSDHADADEIMEEAMGALKILK